MPMIVRWPAKIEAGGVTDHPSAHYDALATIAEIVERKPKPTTTASAISRLCLARSNRPTSILSGILPVTVGKSRCDRANGR